MRTLRLSLVGTVILVLLGGLSGAVGAQDDTDGSAGFTMKITEDELGFWSDKTVFIWQVEASDPRLSGTWTRVQNCLEGVEDVSYPVFSLCVGNVRVENDGGTWLGRFENSGGGMQPRWMEWTMLEGQGEYAGLTAFMSSDDEMGRELDGAGHIIDVELPMPELPPAE